ncbi:MAG: hypothetical protein RIC06_15955 [Cyclobacteriaceae bacterium]
MLLIAGCENRNPSSNETAEELATEEVEADIEEVPQESTEEIPVSEQILAVIKSYQFEKARQLINDSEMNINELFESNRGPKWLVSSTFLTSLLGSCDKEVISFLLTSGANPNLSSVTYGYEEWDPESIPEDIDLMAMEEKGHDGYTIRESPLTKSLSCEDSTIFYSLIKAGADDQTAMMKGAIKWEDTVLLKKVISKEVAVDFVPVTDRADILQMLVPITDGSQYGEIGYGEGGDMFESDLMYACEANDLALVSFMLETGANPNHCLPKNYVDGEYVEPDSAGYYPASTPLSISKELYESSMEIHNNRESDTTYLNKARVSEEIISLLEAHGATNISRCLEP